MKLLIPLLLALFASHAQAQSLGMSPCYLSNTTTACFLPIGVTSGGTGTTTAFTAGSVVFAGPSGVYAQDNTNLFWDDTNNRLGIGTATPAASLELASGKRLYLPEGDQGSPSLAFSTYTNTGLFLAAANKIGFNGGGLPATWDGTSMVLGQFGGTPRIKAASSGVGNLNRAGIDFIVAAGEGTGSGTPSSLLFQTAPADGSGTDLQTLVTRLTISGNGYLTATKNIAAVNLLAGYTTTATAATTTTLTVDSTQQQYFTGSTTQTVLLPVTSTLSLGQQYVVVNTSSGAVTVQSSGANSIQAQIANSIGIYTCILTSGTTAASWSLNYRPLTGVGTVALGSDVSGTLPVANGGTGVTTSTGSGNNVLSTSPTLVTPILGVPQSVTLTSATGLPLTTGVTGVLPAANMTTAATGVAGIVSAATQVLTGIKTFETQLIGKGTGTNDNAAAGYIGEYIESRSSTFSNVGSTGVYWDAGSITLSAGDWDVSGSIIYKRNGATFASTDMEVGISSYATTTTTDLQDGYNFMYNGASAPVTFSFHPLNVGPVRVQSDGTNLYIAGNTHSSVQIVYLKAFISSYSVATPTYTYSIVARRRR